MGLLKTILLYLSMLFVSSVQIAPDASTVDVTPTPEPTVLGVYDTATPEPTATPTPVPTPDITPNSEYGQLVVGDRDDEVTKLQESLAELGYYTGDIDGAYGNQTRTAVELFQYYNGLTVDGIAGKYTQTILYESDDVVAAPTEAVVTATPVFALDETETPEPATATPEATATPTAEPTATPEPTDTPAPEEATVLSTMYFIFDGYSDTLTAEESGETLHPVQLEEELYIPLTEIIKSSGGVVITSTEDSTEEIGFTVLTAFYQVSYVLNEDGSLSDLVIKKDSEPEPMTTRNAVVIDGILYLPLEDITRITGIEFITDEVNDVITVTMPSA